MKIHIKAIRDGNPVYYAYEGMSLDTVLALLQDLGCTDIIQITPEEYLSLVTDQR